MKRPLNQSGFTLIELMIAMALLAVVAGGVTTASRRGLGLFARSSVNSEINARAGRTIDRISRELMGAGATRIDPDLSFDAGDPPVWSTELEFEVAGDWVAGAVVWGPERRIALELAEGEADNGIDDNGNGLVDEGSVVMLENPGQPNERRVVLVNGVSEYLEGEVLNGIDDNGNGLIDERGFCFDLARGPLSIRLSLERLDPEGRLLVRTHSDSVQMRN